MGAERNGVAALSVIAVFVAAVAWSSTAIADPSAVSTASWPGHDLSAATVAIEKPQRPLFLTRLAEAKQAEEHHVGQMTIGGVAFPLSGLQCATSKDPYASTWYTVQVPRHGISLVSIETERKQLSIYLKDGRIFSADIPSSWRAGKVGGELYNQYDFLEVLDAAINARLGKNFAKRYDQATATGDKQTVAKLKPAYEKVVADVYRHYPKWPVSVSSC